MLPEKLLKEFRSAFGMDPICHDTEKGTCIFEQNEYIVIKTNGVLIAQFKDDESSYGDILSFYAKKAGLLSPAERDIEKILRSMFVNLIVLTEVEDRYGFSHSQRVAKIAEGFAMYLNMKPEEVEDLKNHALLHDVGKIAIEQLMLYSPTRLRTFETHYEDHPTMGTIYLSIHESLWRYIPTVRNHHEKWDGTGFPDKLKGTDIPYFARIIAILDYYDEVTNFVSADWDSEIKTPKQAINEIKRMAGTFFDPDLVNKFVEFMQTVHKIEV
ncbi:HD-GYP domain-containing protein [Fervidobacterium gondwanense]|uniref:HD-GYP domain-containing protein n=1 Tax=Fervidobacterium gondwanense TaxID=44754 RepID=UPI003C73A5D0